MALNVRDNIPRDGPCLVEGCDKPRRSRGLCSSHYDCGRRRTQCPACRGLMRDRSGVCAECHRAAIAARLPTEKTCPQCSRTLPVSAFGLRKAGQGSVKWRSRCRECEAANSRLRAKNTQRDRSKERHTASFTSLRRYAKQLGISWAEVVERYPVDNRCELCGRTPEEANPGGRFARLSLDHCHKTGALRGFLCGPCNTGLGQLGDSAERMRAALKYLRRKVPSPHSSSSPVASSPDQLVIPFQFMGGDA
ncbi:endonuclease domain-containing protein [Streptomyces sp. B3I7]|uniref:endonuclease domain-containing protein n=1 Tax=Streptomyces sp. B3I7 TaxID=3042269 RepID=UPI00358F7D12